jgi:hypothetical protein
LPSGVWREVVLQDEIEVLGHRLIRTDTLEIDRELGDVALEPIAVRPVSEACHCENEELRLGTGLRISVHHAPEQLRFELLGGLSRRGLDGESTRDCYVVLSVESTRCEVALTCVGE